MEHEGGHALSEVPCGGAGFQFMIAGFSHDSGFNSFHLLRVILREYRKMALGGGGGVSGGMRKEMRKKEKYSS